MSFICAICRDLLKISEEAPPRHHQHLPPGSPSNHTSTTNINNVSSGRKKSKSNSIVATKCGHLFHYACLSAWLSQSMNLTSDSKMRCPSCKQLIYIYELTQLFPVENGCGNSSSLEQILSVTFQNKLKTIVEHLEILVVDLQKKDGDNNCSCRPSKGNETPTKLHHRIKDSPKKIRVSQLAELMRELDSLRGSIQDLNSFIEQQAKLGSVVDKQSKEISELKSKNEQLVMFNEKLKLNEETTENEMKDDLRSGPSQKIEHVERAEETFCVDNNATSKAAQDVKNLPVVGDSSVTFRNGCDKIETSSVNCDASPACRNPRRKSVTFVDPFDVMVNTSIPLDTTDFRVGDKVVWKFEGNPEIGIVKWKGFVGSEINAGVEFERQLGLPIKDHGSEAIQYIFKSKPGHGRLIPVNELVLSCKDDSRLGSNHKCSDLRNPYEYKNENSNGNNKRIQVCTHQ